MCLLLKLHFKDADQDFNSDVTMTVGWNHSQLISITPVTFRRSANVSLILIKNLDFETEQAHQFQVGDGRRIDRLAQLLKR